MYNLKQACKLEQNHKLLMSYGYDTEDALTVEDLLCRKESVLCSSICCEAL